jgi:hypothetical protein
MKKDIGKWCEYHKIPWHNNEECHSKMKDSKSEANSDLNKILKEGRRIWMSNPVPLSLPPNSGQAN